MRSMFKYVKLVKQNTESPWYFLKVIKSRSTSKYKSIHSDKYKELFQFLK